MVRHLGIRWKVLGVLALPVLAMAISSGTVAVTALSDAAAAQRAGGLSAAGDGFGRVAAALQQERLGSLQVLAGDPSARDRLTAARQRTDTEVAALDLALVRSDVSGLSAVAAAAVDRSRQAHTRLGGLRDDVDAGTVGGALAEQIYTDVVRADVDLPGAIAEGLADRALAQPLTVASLLGRVGEAAAREQLAGLAIIRADIATGAQQRDLAIAVLDADRTIEEVRAHGTPAQLSALTAALTSGRVTDADLGRLRTALTGADTSAPVPVTEADWVFTTGQRAEQLRQVSHLVSAAAATQAGERVAAARLRAAVALGSVVVLVGASVLLALVLSRRITAPLRRLTDDVTRLAAELPTIAGKVATGQDVELPEVVVDGTDEVGALAVAFRSVNATTLEVAVEQAGLRAAVSDLFVSVARRNQVLLSRQLAFIDQLERTEESPEGLENLFRLDHLATRMRRNAESLLVLAGADGGRRLRSPMPLSDVVRTAVSEIEHFHRVRLDVQADLPVVAHLALPAAHLVAELVENATAFSEPGAPVLVETRAIPDGIRVSVRDCGLGLSVAELADANARLANGDVADVVGSKRLGFFVVARLAAKIGARVHLAAGTGGGTVAHVDLGPVAFVAQPWAPVGLVAPQPVLAGAAATATATGAEAGVEAGVEVPAPPLAVDLETGLRAVVEPVADDPLTDPNFVVEAPGPTPEPAPEVAAAATGLNVPLGAMTVDVLPAGHQHRGGLLRGRLARATDARTRGTGPLERPADPSPEPVRRAVTSQEPPSRRAIRDGLGWLPPESPDLFPGKDSGSARRWGRADDQDEERLRHALTSEALNELSRLSSYSPTTVHAAPPESLTRRTPAAAPQAQDVAAPQAQDVVAQALAAPLFGSPPPERFAETSTPADGPAPAGGLPSRPRHQAAAEPAAAALPPRPRTADGVRSTVTGFTDGVRRARRAAPAVPAAPGPEQEPTAPITRRTRP